MGRRDYRQKAAALSIIIQALTASPSHVHVPASHREVSTNTQSIKAVGLCCAQMGTRSDLHIKRGESPAPVGLELFPLDHGS